ARATTEGSAFRLNYVLGRTIVVVGLVLSYGQICRLITSVAGAGGGWLSTAEYYDLSEWDRSKEALGQAWDSSSMADFVVIALIWMVTMISALFAFIASTLLSLSQAVLITILLGLGKICLVASLVPGVTVAKGWARALAQVAA